ncbi:hypothetical protein OKW21_002600 [Catalinimonas alkaloidigena]|uniref:hypothetical protein n=1 Tax=Catalinimonas alkaloidigena TaxID=1075417 RepID=UPI0024072F1F|nr:hypothetical protein [Catalinimonas alkaloidigena]MDF9797337.1 hypothetical protein [Catalinimonas alkaloidigena]
MKFVFRKDALNLAQFNVDKVSNKSYAWPMQANYFSSKTGEYIEQLSQHGLTAADLAQGKAMVEAVTHARNQRLLTKGEAEETIQMKDMSVKVLKRWMSEFLTTTRLRSKTVRNYWTRLAQALKPKKFSRCKSEDGSINNAYVPLLASDYLLLKNLMGACYLG